MNFTNLTETVASKACDLRNICTLLKRPDFQRIYDACTDYDREQVQKLVDAGAHEALRTWYRLKLHCELGDKSVRELRVIASALAIPDYTRLQKSILLFEIVKRQKHDDKSDKIAS